MELHQAKPAAQQGRRGQVTGQVTLLGVVEERGEKLSVSTELMHQVVSRPLLVLLLLNGRVKTTVDSRTFPKLADAKIVLQNRV